MSACQCRRHKGILPNEEEDEECSEEVVKSSLWGSSSGSVFIFGQISLSFSHIRPVLGHSGKMHGHLLHLVLDPSTVLSEDPHPWLAAVPSLSPWLSLPPSLLTSKPSLSLLHSY